jgi:hypothetical protein
VEERGVQTVGYQSKGDLLMQMLLNEEDPPGQLMRKCGNKNNHTRQRLTFAHGSIKGVILCSRESHLDKGRRRVRKSRQ